MSDPKEKSVKFNLNDASLKHVDGNMSFVTSSDAELQSSRIERDTSNKMDSQKKMPLEDDSTLESEKNSQCDNEIPSVTVESHIDEMPRRPKYTFCYECGKEIPIDEWPDHRDRLDRVMLVEQVSTFHKTIIQVFGGFIMWILKNVYFREVTIVGEENIPPAGAVVFYGNHRNQFIDALMIASNCDRNPRFIMAKKSYIKGLVGFFGRMFNAVPVIRPQDVPLTPGKGRLVRMDGVVVIGEDTHFTTTLGKGDVIMWAAPPHDRCTAQIIRIHSDTEIEVTVPIQTDHYLSQPTHYQVSRRIDHSKMYADVYDTLQKNHCITIFPEGGSHDHTSLLPLKAGVALFSLGAAERHISVKIVPCGLTYCYGHKFRSRAYLEFGKPITPPEELVTMFSTDKRKATGVFLRQLDDALRAVTINVPDWGTLNFLHSFRQLYQPVNCMLSAGDYLLLMRRLSSLIDQEKDNPELIEFRSKVTNYHELCDALLVRDSQTATLKHLVEPGKEGAKIRLLLRRAFALFLMGVILIPFFIIGLPIGCIIKYYSNKKAKLALSESKVKLVGADVKGSLKLTAGFFLVPLAVLFITFLTFFFTDLRTSLVILFSLPMALYVSLIILQEAIMELRAALPLFMSLIAKHKQFNNLYKKRQELVTEAKFIVCKYYPKLDKEMEVYTTQVAGSDDDLEREPSLFSLRYNVRRRQATKA
ncbi:unnamed protein product [Phytomonas sp. Hart1]|nr:unnamed protein product [Phytomonas sp. Hart1]|eukprot:CCW69775.1 unnamed protein product [Phytomonas sp. isolate Hart1]